MREQRVLVAPVRSVRLEREEEDLPSTIDTLRPPLRERSTKRRLREVEQLAVVLLERVETHRRSKRGDLVRGWRSAPVLRGVQKLRRVEVRPLLRDRGALPGAPELRQLVLAGLVLQRFEILRPHDHGLLLLVALALLDRGQAPRLLLHLVLGRWRRRDQLVVKLFLHHGSVLCGDAGAFLCLPPFPQHKQDDQRGNTADDHPDWALL